MYVAKVTNTDGRLRAYARNLTGEAVARKAARDYGRSLEDCAVELACDTVGDMLRVGGCITGEIATTGPDLGAFFVVVTFSPVSPVDRR